MVVSGTVSLAVLPLECSVTRKTSLGLNFCACPIIGFEFLCLSQRHRIFTTLLNCLYLELLHNWDPDFYTHGNSPCGGEAYPAVTTTR